MAATAFGVIPAEALDPSDPRAGYGFPNVETNGFGHTDSWGGSFSLYTGHDQTGEFFLGYCIDRGANYPRGTDPQFADANSGFTQIGDVPAQRGVPAATRGALSYALWRYGNSTDPTTAGAMFVLAHVMSGDPTFGSSSVVDTVLGAGWPDPAAVKARAQMIEQEAYAKRGPWNLSVNVSHISGNQFQVHVDLTGPAGAIAYEQVAVQVQNGSGGGTLITDANGRISFTTTASNPNLPVTVNASKTQVPAGQNYRVFEGNPGTQRVITAGPNGAAISHQASAEVPYGSAQIVKVTDNPAYQSGQGAEFEVRQGGPAGPVVGTLIVGANGQSNVLGQLDPGTYTVIETAAPEGQVLDPTPHTIQVAAGDIGIVQASNEVLREAVLRFVKLDDTTNEPLAGAMISVRYDSNGDGTYDTPVGPGPDGVFGDDPSTPDVDESADDGLYVSTTEPTTLTGLPVGNYQVTEVAPPPGYTLPDLDNRVQAVSLTYGNHATPDDNVLEQQVDFRNRVPLVRTQVVAPVDPNEPGAQDRPDNLMNVGDTFADHVIVENVASDVVGTVTADLYGPFQTGSDIECTDDTLHSSQTFQVIGSGLFRSPDFTVDVPGLYTFVETWEGEDGSSATHDCGEVTETIAFPEITTEVSDQVVGLGEPIYDTAIVSGVLDGQPGVVTVRLYGPFDVAECAVTAVPADGSDPEPSDTRSCAPVECVAPPAPGADPTDPTDVPEGCDPTLVYELANPGGIDCSADSLVWETTYEVTGTGSFPSPPVTPEFAGVYTFVEEWTEVLTPEQEQAGDTPVTVSHDCGLVEETTTVHPEIETRVSAESIIVPGTIYDTSVLTGVPDHVRGTAVYRLYGPFKSVEDIECTEDTLYTTVEAETVGSGDHRSPDIEVSQAGVYTFVEEWTSENGTLTADHDCGLTEETFTASNPPSEPGLPVTGASVTIMVLSGMALVAGGIVIRQAGQSL